MSQWKLVAVLVAGAVSLGACTEAPVGTAPQVGPSLAISNEASQTIADQHVFTLHGGRATSEITAAVTAAGGTVRYSMDAIGVVLTRGLSNAAAAKIASGKAVVANDLQARWVPSLQMMGIESIPADALGELKGASLLPPQAAAFKAYQWNMRITDTDDAWAQGKTGLPSVRVAILDTGLDAYHIDQMGLIDMANSIAFVPSKTGPPLWEDDNFHGTHVGGIVTSNNFGVAGVAPNVTLVAVKVLDEHGDGSLGDVIAGIYYAADIGVEVINMSLGATFPKNEAQGVVPAFNRAVNYAHGKGVFIAAASGNDGEDLQHNANRVSVPCETGVLTCISATGPADELAPYSNYGTNAINNAAPGGDFTMGGVLGMVLSLCSSHSTDPYLAGCKPQDTPFGFVGTNYVFAEGTSMASPHVAGLGALLDSQYGGSLNGSQIITAIQQSADDLGKPGADAFYGKGRMNTCRTLPGCVPVANP
jgi:subtilisin family serine protease